MATTFSVVTSMSGTATNCSEVTLALSRFPTSCPAVTHPRSGPQPHGQKSQSLTLVTPKAWSGVTATFSGIKTMSQIAPTHSEVMITSSRVTMIRGHNLKVRSCNPMVSVRNFKVRSCNPMVSARNLKVRGSHLNVRDRNFMTL